MAGRGIVFAHGTTRPGAAVAAGARLFSLADQKSAKQERAGKSGSGAMGQADSLCKSLAGHTNFTAAVKKVVKAPTINGYWRFSPDRPETRPHKPATTYPQELSTSRQRHACCRLLLTDVDRPLFLETDSDNKFVGHKLSAGGIPRVSAIAAVNRQPRSTRTGCRLRQPRSTRTGCRLPPFTGIDSLRKQGILRHPPVGQGR